MPTLSKVKLNKAESESYFVKQSYTYVGDDYWDWSVWIESKSPEKLDKISSVTYHLHYTFPDPVRIVRNRKSNFRLDTSGWGTFTIYIVIKLKDKSLIQLEHDLTLAYPATKKNTKKN